MENKNIDWDVVSKDVSDAIERGLHKVYNKPLDDSEENKLSCGLCGSMFKVENPTQINTITFGHCGADEKEVEPYFTFQCCPNCESNMMTHLLSIQIESISAMINAGCFGGKGDVADATVQTSEESSS